jgi:type VI secretion system protein ImpH
MATAGRAAVPFIETSELRQLLEDEPFRFRFFQAVRALSKLAPDREMVGGFANPRDEVVRFSTNSTLSFAASEIQGFERTDHHDQPVTPPRMVVNFFGLTGLNGALPVVYTELVMERMRAKDRALHDFLDIFNHRFISLFYQAWEKYRFGAAYERGDLDNVSKRLLDLVGLGTGSLQAQQDVRDESLLLYSGLLAHRPRSAAGLEQMLSDYFDVPVEAQQFAGAWYRLPRSSMTQLNDSSSPAEQLGLGTIVGDEVWDQQAAVRVCIGPLAIERYLDFLPGGKAHDRLRAMLRFYSNDEFDFQLKLILKREQTPACELGSQEVSAPRLGWVSWMKNRPLDRDPGDTILYV